MSLLIYTRDTVVSKEVIGNILSIIGQGLLYYSDLGSILR